METESIINFFLIINSLLLIVLIFNQNDNTKESISNKNSRTNSLTSPLEKATWVLVALELIGLIIKIKITSI